MNRNSIREMSVQDSSDKTTLDNPSFHPWTPHWKIPVDWTVSIRRSGHRPASILFFIYTTPLPPPQESYERQLKRRWDLKVVLLRTQFRLNAPRHFSWSHFVGHWLSPVLAHYPLLLTVLCKFCLPPTDNIVWRERRGERIVDCAEVEIGIELIATLKFRRRLVDPVSLSLV